MARSLQHTRASSHSRISARALAVVAIAALSACGGSTEDSLPSEASPASDATSTEAANTTAPVATTAPVTTAPVTDAPDTTQASVPSDPPVTSAVTVEMTPELAAFAEANGELVNDWSTQLNAFGEEAIDHLDDVSKAPTAASVAELSAELVEAVDEDATDRGLITLRAFADGVTIAIGYAADGDHDSALSVFLGLQAQSDALTAVLDQLDA